MALEYVIERGKETDMKVRIGLIGAGRIGKLHGKMDPKEKLRQMEAFSNGTNPEIE